MRHSLVLLILLVSRPILGCDPDRIQSTSPVTDKHLAALVACLASPDPELRDQLAYTTLAKILRGTA